MTTLLRAWSDRDLRARDQLMPVVYGELHRRAAAQLRRERRDHTLQPTALVHEAYLRLVDQRATWKNRAQFLGVAAQMMRRVLVDHARRRKMMKRSGRWVRVTLDEGVAEMPAPDVELLDLDAALTRLATFDSRKSQIAELRFFGGLSLEETGHVLGLSIATVERDWQAARAGLFAAMKGEVGRDPDRWRAITEIWRRETLAWTLVALLAALSAIAVGMDVYGGHPPTGSDLRFEIATSHANAYSLSISPNGRLVAYVARAPGTDNDVLWLRPLAATIAQPLPGTEGASAPFWSPDSRSVGFGARGTIRRVDTGGGQPRTVCDVPGADYFGGTWSPDNTIVFSSGSALLRVAAEGGQPTPITTLDRSSGETAHRYPSFLPDGRHFIYSILSTDPAIAGVYVGAPDVAGRKRVLDAISMTAYAEPGFLIYQNSGALMAQPFDASRLRVGGTPVRIAESVATPFVTPVHRLAGLAAFAVSANGALIYRTADARNLSARLQWFDRTGKPLDQIGQPGVFGDWRYRQTRGGWHSRSKMHNWAGISIPSTCQPACRRV